MSTTIDNLQIEIKSSSVDAAQGIDALAESLGNLKKNGTISTAVKNLNNLSAALRNLPNVHGSANALRTLANSIEKLKGVGTVSSLSNSLQKLPTALKALSGINLEKTKSQLENVADAVSPLSAIKAGGLNTMVNSMKNLGKVADSLDDGTIGRFAQKVELLAGKLSPLSLKMENVKSGFNAINSSAKSASRSVEDFGEEIDVTALNLSSWIDVARTVADSIQNIVQGFINITESAIEWDGIAARFGRSFGNQAQETYEWIQRLNEEMGINVQQFMQYSSLYAQMLTGFGVANEDAGKMALGYTELTYDIWASANDRYKSFADAADAVASAIAGEVEPIRRAGFTIVESTLEETAAYYGLDISIANATESQKSYLRYLTLVQQAQNNGVIGVYADELDTAEGLMRTFTQQLKSLSQAFGSLFLPVLVKVMPYVQAFVELLEDAVRWIAGLFGVEIQDIGDTWNDYTSGASEAVENTAGITDGLKDATKAAKELKNATIGIDELNVISPNSATGGAGAGAGTGGGAGGGGFEGIDVGSLWDEKIFDNIQSDVDAIKEKMRGWLPIIASVSAGLAGLRLVKLIKDIKNLTALSGGLAAVGGALGGIKEFFKAAKQNAPEVGWFAALTPKLSAWIAGLPALLSSAASALAVAAPWIGIAIAVVGGIILAFVEYDFTDVGYTVGKKVGEAIKWAFDYLTPIGLSIKFGKWLMKELDVDTVWELIKVLFTPATWTEKIFPAIGKIFDDVTKWIGDKIKNWKGNVNELFGGFFDGLFDGLGWDMTWADKFTEFFDIDYLAIVEMIANPFAIGKYIVNGIWKGLTENGIIEKFKTWCSDIITKVKSVFGIASPSKVFAEIGKYCVEGLVGAFKPSAIKDKIVSMWNTAKSWWDKKPSLKSYTPSIGSIYDKLKPRWDNAREWWNNKKSAMKTYTPSIGSIYEKVYDRWKNARDWWNSKKGSFKTYTPSIGSITDKLKSAWNSAKSWWSKNVKLSTKLNISVPTIKVKWETASAFGKSFKYPTGFNLKFAAAGGVFDQGSLIWAGERGPEVMANASGGRTGVMNIEQMQEAVYEGVYSAMIAAMRGNSEGGSGQPVNIYLDGRVIARSVEKAQRERGTSIMGNEVYSY